MEIVQGIKQILIKFEETDTHQEKRLIRAKIDEFLAITHMISEKYIESLDAKP